MYHFIGYVVQKEVEGINQTYLTRVSCKVSLLNHLVKSKLIVINLVLSHSLQHLTQCRMNVKVK